MERYCLSGLLDILSTLFICFWRPCNHGKVLPVRTIGHIINIIYLLLEALQSWKGIACQDYWTYYQHYLFASGGLAIMERYCLSGLLDILSTLFICFRRPCNHGKVLPVRTIGHIINIIYLLPEALQSWKGIACQDYW